MNPHRLPPYEAGSPARRWLQTVLAAVLATGLLVLAFFFAVFALVAATLLVAALAARWWWLVRRARKASQQASNAVVEGEYRVVERDGEDDGAGRR